MSQSNVLPPLSRPPASQPSASGPVVNADGNGSGNGNGNGSIDAASGGGIDANGASDDGESQSASPIASPIATPASRSHDHTRPFPPPRIPVTSTPARIPLTVPLAPLSSSSSFRSRSSGSATRRPQVPDSPPSDGNSRSLLSTVVDIVAPPRSPVAEVSLSTPRPDGERVINEYVETPFKNSSAVAERRLEGDAKRNSSNCSKSESRRSRVKGALDGNLAPLHRSHRHARSHAFDSTSANILVNLTGGTTSARANAAAAAAAAANAANAVTKQPVSFTKEPANASANRAYDPAGLSIICEYCGKCRCESCREPHPLPSRWLCNNSCFCSAETVLDYASCLCCAKGLFYHCVDSNGTGGGAASTGGVGAIDSAASCADEPCSCTGNRTLSRWACLSALTLAMPCLLCYWPLRGCVAICEACYSRHASQGCRCNPNAVAATTARHHPTANEIGYSRDPEKRLLDPVTPDL